MNRVRVASGQGTAAIERWAPRDIRLRVACETNCTLVVHQFYYPGWRAEGFAVDASEQGLIRIAVGRGEHEFRLRLDGGRMESAGRWLSAVCILGMIFSVQICYLLR